MESNANKPSELKLVILDTGIATKTIENVKIIRIKSERYNLLVMKDHCPIIAEINGSVMVEADEPLKLENIKAFYALSKNVFHLIIREKTESAKES